MLDGTLLVNELVDYVKRYKRDMFLFKVDMENIFLLGFLGVLVLYP